MVDGCECNSISVRPCAVLAGDAKIRGNQALGGNSAQAHNDFGLHQLNLPEQVAYTGFLLRFLRVPVSGWAALDNVGNIAIAK